jgi:hypothetical protein
MMRPAPFVALRLSMLLASLAVAAFAIWSIAAEAIRPGLDYFPRDATEAKAFGDASGQAASAAYIGMIRGDLWTVAATTLSAPLLFGHPARDADARVRADAARSDAAYAARLSPYDPRNWLVLAALATNTGTGPRATVEPLKLSYYTGTSDLALAPLRIAVATRGNAIEDGEIAGFVALEIQQWMTKQPEAKAALAGIHAGASPEGRKAIETAAAKVDPAFAASLTRK